MSTEQEPKPGVEERARALAEKVTYNYEATASYAHELERNRALILAALTEEGRASKRPASDVEEKANNLADAITSTAKAACAAHNHPEGWQSFLEWLRAELTEALTEEGHAAERNASRITASERQQYEREIERLSNAAYRQADAMLHAEQCGRCAELEKKCTELQRQVERTGHSGDCSIYQPGSSICDCGYFREVISSSYTNPGNALWFEWVAHLVAIDKQVHALDRALEVLSAPDWTPTSDNINALPEPLRRYIHEVETRCDPAGETRERVIAQENCLLLDKQRDTLRRQVEQLENALRLILPMAKGYAHAHQVGDNQGKIESAEAALSPVQDAEPTTTTAEGQGVVGGRTAGANPATGADCKHEWIGDTCTLCGGAYHIIKHDELTALKARCADMESVMRENRQLKLVLIDTQARCAELEKQLAESEGDYDELSRLLNKRFPKRPDGTLPDFTVEDVLRENNTLTLANELAEHLRQQAEVRCAELEHQVLLLKNDKTVYQFGRNEGEGVMREINRGLRERIAGLEARAAAHLQDLQERLAPLIASCAGLRERCEELERERDMWKANHDNQVKLKQAIADRPDMGERARSFQRMADRIAELERERDNCRAVIKSNCEDDTRIRELVRPLLINGLVKGLEQERNEAGAERESLCGQLNTAEGLLRQAEKALSLCDPRTFNPPNDTTIVVALDALRKALGTEGEELC